MSRLFTSCCKVLREGAEAVCGSGMFDGKGYCRAWRENLSPYLAASGIEKDLLRGAGMELKSKFLAAHSSSALAVNAFGAWRENARAFTLGNNTYKSLHFEARCSSGLRGTPPHLDVLATGDGMLAIESKCTEWMKRKPADFVDSYDKLATRWQGSPWVEMMQRSKTDPNHFQHLDVAQLITHAFGLMHTFPDKLPTLLYLFWEPTNCSRWSECSKHRKEVAEFLSVVAGGEIDVQAKSYNELWAEGCFASLPEDGRRYFETRYLREVPN